MLTLLNLPRKISIYALRGFILGLFAVAVIVFFSCYGLSWCLDKVINWLDEKPRENKVPKN
jgi:hypothetical protein